MKKSNGKISRNLILSSVLLVTIILVVLAWFSNSSRADANGISITSATARGLQVAFNDDDSEYSDKIVDESEKNYPLVSSGDGKNFFIPLLNRSIGEALTPYQSKREAEPGKDYYETDLWFRSSEPLNVLLRNDSDIRPKNLEGNLSTFGNFSKDYIAGAARVAFFNVDENGTEKLNKIWIPNKNYELSNQGNFSPIEIYTDGGGDQFDVDNPDKTFGLTDLPKSDYYLWEGYTDSGKNQLLEAPQHRTVYEREDGTYVAAVTVVSTAQVDHAILVSNKDESYHQDTNYTGQQRHDCSTYYDDCWVGAYFDYDKYIYFDGRTNQWSKLVVEADPNTLFEDVDRFQILVECSFDDQGNANNLKVIGFAFYNSKDGVILGGAGDGNFGGDSKYYKLETDKSVVLTGTNDTGLYALSAASNNVSARKISRDIVTSLPYVDSQYLFSVEAGSSEGLYKLKSTAEQKYLSVSGNGEISLSSTASQFSVVVGSDSNDNDVPVLKCGSFYIIFNGTNFTTSTELISATNNIYQGKSFSFTDNGNIESNYTYIMRGLTSPSFLDDDKYFTDISDAPTIASLSEIDQSGYYKAHIKVRIWVEGTDREAKTPLAGGIFDNILMFEGHKTEETT